MPWPGGSLVGRTTRLGRIESNAPWVRVVGVAGSSRVSLNMFVAELKTEPMVYVVRAQHDPWTSLVARADPRVRGVRLAIQRHLSAALPGYSLIVQTWLEEYR